MPKSKLLNALPPEIEVWYVLPAMRRELARILVRDHDLSQREAAQALGITEAAISQYLSAKRGSDIKFSPQEMKKIAKTAEIILKEKKNLISHLYKLLTDLRGSEAMCRLHRKFDKEVPAECKICQPD